MFNKRRRRYFLNPRNNFTDQMINPQAIYDECSQKKCADGATRHLYEVTKEIFDHVWNSRRSQPGIDVARFWQTGDGLIRSYYKDQKYFRVRGVVGRKQPRLAA